MPEGNSKKPDNNRTAIIAAVLSGLLAGTLSFLATTATNQNALEVVRQTSAQAADAEALRLDRDRKESAYLNFLSAVEALHPLRSAQWDIQAAADLRAWIAKHKPMNPPRQLPSPPPPDKNELSRRVLELRAAANKIQLVVDLQDVRTVSLLGSHLLDDPSPAPASELNDPTEQPGFSAKKESEYVTLRLTFINTYRDRVLKIGTLPIGAGI